MKIVFFLLTGLVFIILQTTVFQMIPEWMSTPDLLFLLILFISLKWPLFRGSVMVLFFAWIMDIVSGVFLGLHAAVYLSLFLLIKGLLRHLSLDHPIHLPGLVAAGYLVVSTATYFFTVMLGPETQYNWPWMRIILQMFILSVISIPFFTVCNAIHGLFADKAAAELFGRKQPTNRFRD